jgi:hypothetical protein
LCTNNYNKLFYSFIAICFHIITDTVSLHVIADIISLHTITDIIVQQPYEGAIINISNYTAEKTES